MATQANGLQRRGLRAAAEAGRSANYSVPSVINAPTKTEASVKQSLVGVGLACFVLGALGQAGFAQTKKPTFSPDLFKGKEAIEAATALLDGALQLAGAGSWERIAVGRAWYLGGNKVKGQEIFDSVTNSSKVEHSDWFRIGRIYAEAREWDKAQAAFDRALAMKESDDSGMIEYGALANVNKDRPKAEALFEKAMKKNPQEFWHWLGAGASYLGVLPQ
jgi:tetratricopeptide (TPR) repeat protein